jgi:hypothetical protein
MEFILSDLIDRTGYNSGIIATCRGMTRTTVPAQIEVITAVAVIIIIVVNIIILNKGLSIGQFCHFPCAPFDTIQLISLHTNICTGEMNILL